MKIQGNSKHLRKIFLMTAFAGILWLLPQQVSAHCDSYDGPVVKDALAALEARDVAPVLKWIQPQYEDEITTLFQKTIKYKKDDSEVYELLEKHFLETLVRLHREGEGEPYTGLKPAGSTSKIITMTDAALHEERIDPLVTALTDHLGNVVREKYEKVAKLRKLKDSSSEAGREFVAAYVDYTHSIEVLYEVMEHDNDPHASH